LSLNSGSAADLQKSQNVPARVEEYPWFPIWREGVSPPATVPFPIGVIRKGWTIRYHSAEPGSITVKELPAGTNDCMFSIKNPTDQTQQARVILGNSLRDVSSGVGQQPRN